MYEFGKRKLTKSDRVEPLVSLNKNGFRFAAIFDLIIMPDSREQQESNLIIVPRSKKPRNIVKVSQQNDLIKKVPPQNSRTIIASWSTRK